MKLVKIPFQINSNYNLYPELRYILDVLERSNSVKFIPEDGIKASLTFSDKFEELYNNKSTSYKEYLNPQGFITDQQGNVDSFGTAFYHLSALQEYDNSDPDKYGRFQFKNSLQNQFGLTEDNIVESCFNRILQYFSYKQEAFKSRVLLTHDIDTVYEAIYQDGYYLLKKGRIDLLFKLLFHVMIGKPDWLNMDLIMKIESDYDFKSIFFWIANQSKPNGVKNADYNIRSKPIQRNIASIHKNKFQVGIHKGIGDATFNEELANFNPRPKANRYHYLKFNLPNGFDEIERAGLQLDASMGYAETHGFRINYGLPFTPFNLIKRKPYNFVEVPLHIMDTTFFTYKKITAESAEQEIIRFIDKNNENAVLSILWHNNFFTNYKYKGYLNLYKRLLGYFKESGLTHITQEEIISKYLIQ